MMELRLKSGLQRASIGGFALPLGLIPTSIRPPTVGYTFSYNPSREDEPDTYTFEVVVSHERLRPLIGRAFALLPEEVFAVVEIGSRDAYRMMDVHVGERTITREAFLEGWARHEPFLLEDCSIGVGARSEEPLLEVFLDAWKILTIHVPLSMRDDVEELLQSEGLEEVPMTWPEEEEDDPPHGWRFRPVLELPDGTAAEADDLLTRLRQEWRLVLNVDPESNIDEAGRELGLTLWQAVISVGWSEGGRRRQAYVSLWAAAGSLATIERFVEQALEERPQWKLLGIDAMDRVAYDDRPEELAHLPPRPEREEIHLVVVEPGGDATALPPPASGEQRG
ncbi:MAG: hypothetical protein JSV91_13635 [Phycisphaerales bacterium]|nr:MAG: hypothetical protein JSV91_13635 [Phycisphaerales bacterium]